jgi:beta-lactamase regulating signal transducer with metallopeptidase domain
MIGVALYVLVASALLSVGGWLADRILASLDWPRRGAWIGAMLLTVVVPAWHLPGALPDASPVEVSAPAAARVPGTPLPAASRSPNAPPPAESVAAQSAPTRSASSAAHRVWTATLYRRVLVLFLACWGGASAVMLMRLWVGGVLLRRRSRRWERTLLDGITVTVSDGLGPAVLGIVRPRIIVPRWLSAESVQMRSVVLAHESEHLRARDGYVLLGARLLIALIPWNLPVWWLWRRLRLAIEIDCDARVVRRGMAATSYAEGLLAIATRIPGPPRPEIGLFERRSHLARRIRILLSPSRKCSRWAALPLYALTGLAALAAGTFPAPPIDAALGARNQSERTAHEMSEAGIQDARATRRLLASGQPYALAAAAVLGWPYPDGMRITDGRTVIRRVPSDATRRLAWLARAVAKAPDQVDLVMLERDYCRNWNPRCDVASLDARLQALDPHNGFVWLDALQMAVASRDSAGIDAALAAIGRTGHVDAYRNHLFAHLVEVLHGIAGEDFVSASEQLAGIGRGIRLNAMIAFSSVCNRRAPALGAARLALCRKAALAFEHGDTFEVADTGSEIAMRLWPAGTPQHERAAIRNHRRDYLIRQAGRLWSPGGLHRLVLVFDSRRYLEHMYALNVRLDGRYPREQDALRAELIAAGLGVTPPPLSKDQ